jgi:hypothetical protein
LADYWQKTTKRVAEKWRFAEVDISGARNNFGGYCPGKFNAVSFLLMTAFKFLLVTLTVLSFVAFESD